MQKRRVAGIALPGYIQSRIYLKFETNNSNIQGPPYIFAPLLTFLKFPASFKKSSKTNYTSIESPNIELFESGKKMGVAPSWGWPHTPE